MQKLFFWNQKIQTIIKCSHPRNPITSPDEKALGGPLTSFSSRVSSTLTGSEPCRRLTKSSASMLGRRTARGRLALLPSLNDAEAAKGEGVPAAASLDGGRAPISGGSRPPPPLPLSPDASAIAGSGRCELDEGCGTTPPYGREGGGS